MPFTYGAGAYGAGAYGAGDSGAGGSLSDFYGDVYGDTYGAAPAPAGPLGPAESNWFDAESWPRVVVMAAFTAPVADCVLGTGVLGTDTVGGIVMVDISADVRSLTWTRGRETDIDTASPGTAAIVLNNVSGDYDPTNLSGPYVSGGVSRVDIGTTVTIHAERPAGLFRPRYTGQIADVQITAGWDPLITLTVADGLETLGRVQLPVESAQREGDTTGARIGHLADRAAWPTTARQIDTGRVTLGATILGDNALELMHKTEQTEFGLLFVDATGNLVFYERHRASTAARSAVVQAELTDLSGPGDLGMVDLELALSRARVYNDAHITREPTVEDALSDTQPVEQIAQDTTSIARYGTLSFPASVGQLLKSDPEAKGLAEGLVLLYATAIVRIREVRINALRQHPGGDDLWPTLLSLGLLDRISVRRDYGGPHVVTAELLIQSITEEITSDPPGWEIRLTTSEPTPAVDYCTLGEGVIGTDNKGW